MVPVYYIAEVDDVASCVLLCQSSSGLSVNLLKKIMCLEKYSGGDSSGKLVDMTLPYKDMRVIQYNKSNSKCTYTLFNTYWYRSVFYIVLQHMAFQFSILY